MFLESTGHNWPRSIEKSCLSSTVWSHKGSTFVNNKKRGVFWPKFLSWGIWPICVVIPLYYVSLKYGDYLRLPQNLPPDIRWFEKRPPARPHRAPPHARLCLSWSWKGDRLQLKPDKTRHRKRCKSLEGREFCNKIVCNSIFWMQSCRMSNNLLGHFLRTHWSLITTSSIDPWFPEKCSKKRLPIFCDFS